MSTKKSFSIVVLITLLVTACIAPLPVTTPTLTEVISSPTLPPTATVTLTPTSTPIPTITITPSPTEIAGGNGNLILGCTDASEESQPQNKIFMYDLASSSLEPRNPKLVKNESLIHSETIFAASPEGHLIFWQKCTANMLSTGECRHFISDGSLSVQEYFPAPGEKPDESFRINGPFSPPLAAYDSSYLFVSEDRLFFATYLNYQDAIRGEALMGKALYLLDIRSGTRYPLSSRENGYPGDFYLSPDGDFVAESHFAQSPNGDWESIIEVIDVHERKLLDLRILGSKPEWVTHDKFIYLDGNLGKHFLVNVETGRIVEVEKTGSRLSPTGDQLAYFELSSQGLQFFIEDEITRNRTSISFPTWAGGQILRWSPDGTKLIYILYPNRSRQQVMIYDLDNQTVSQLMEIESRKYWGFHEISWSQDGRWFTLGFMKDQDMMGFPKLLDYYMCNYNGCTLLEPPDTSYCSKAVWASQ